MMIATWFIIPIFSVIATFCLTKTEKELKNL